jgi:16S rRNA (adenine1518-N6/adenine1519-N6)-dimethyltransferase
MVAPDGLPPLREVIRAHGLDARQSLGQHFLFDLNLTRRIARAAGDLTTGTTIEIGPGPGGLTRGLLMEGAATVMAVERDARCRAALDDVAAAYPGRLTLVDADALDVALTELGPPPRRVVANLPYNVGTQLLLGWLQAIAREPGVVETLTLMFQREVADRLLAAPRTKAYGRLTVLTQWLCTVARVLTVPREAFTPAPKVTSTVVNLTPRAEPAFPADAGSLQAVTGAAFGQRRKMLRQSLKRLTAEPAGLCAAAGVDPTARADALDVGAFCALARVYAGDAE